MENLPPKKFLLFFFLFAFLIHDISFAGSRIVDVDFEGLIKADELALRKKIASTEGSVYSEVLVNRDIKELYQTGLFQDVYVKTTEIAGGIKLTFYVQEKGVIRSIVFEGNKKIKKKDLLNAISLREFNVLDEKRLAESKEAIQKLYADKGDFLAEITSEVVPYDTESSDLELIFHIRESNKVKIKRIAFVGNKAFSDKKLASEMRTKVKGFFSFISGSGKLVDEKLETDAALLTYFYLNQGYIKVKVGKPQVTLTRDKKAIYITIPVYEGSRYKVGKVTVAGDIITSEQELVSKLELKAGEFYTRMNQDKDVVSLETLYGDQAYAFANIYPNIDTDDAAFKADVVYVIQKGPKISLEKIEIKGNMVTRDKVIRRELQVFENAPYHRSNLDLSKKRLMQLGFFEDVNFSTPRGSQDDTVNLIVDVKEKSTGSFSLGAGFSSFESFIFSASVQKDNFFGYGIGGGMAANISKLRQEFNLRLTDRYFLDTRWIVSLSAFRLTSALNRDFDEKAFGGTLSFGRELFNFFDVSAGYNIEDVEVNNFSSQVPAYFQNNASGLTSSVVTSVSYDTRDNRVYTKKGTYNAVTNEYAGNGLGGSNDFWKLQYDGRIFFKLVGKTVLKARGLFGYINSLDDNTVPLFERFFLGGINTLRGFDLNSLGPEITIPKTPSGGDTPFTYGGNRMLMTNLEYVVPIYEPAGIQSVIFMDAGQAYGETEEIDITKLRADYGFGLRWQSPFGPLRFEWGFPIDRRSGESFSVFNFSIGQSF